MMQLKQKTILLGLFLYMGIPLIFAQEPEAIESSYPAIHSIDPYTFKLSELAQLDLVKIKNQAFIAMIQKDYETAARYYLYLVSHNADDALSYYNLARCYAFLAEENYASNFLIMAINNGYNNFTQVQEEEAFALLLQNPDFSETYNAVVDAGQSLGTNIYVNAEKLVKCRVFLPENYNPEKSYPLLIGMHGFGGTTEGFTQLWNFHDTHSYIFVIPEAPYPSSPDTYKANVGFSWDMRVRNLDLYKRSDHLTSEFIINVKNYVSEHYRIDKSYIIGFSQGGGYAYVTGIKNPDEFEGIICFGARIPNTEKYPWFLSEEDIKNGSNLKVFVAHGKQDHSKNAIEAKRKLKRYKYDVGIYLFNGGHIVDQEAYLKALHWMGIQ